MTVENRFRDSIKKYAPWWLSDRYPGPLRTAYTMLWAMVAPFDAISEAGLQGLQAPWPGVGTPTALEKVGVTRGIARGEDESDDDYSARLRGWLDRWKIAGSAESVALTIHEYLGNHPRVRCVDRAGHWVTVETDGTVTKQFGPVFDWDSVSNPERAGNWSEMWIIVYPTEWADAGVWDDGRLWDGTGFGLGHNVSRPAFDAVKTLLGLWKGAHMFIRAVIFTSDATLFDPNTPASLPDGTWGNWSKDDGSGTYVAARNVTTCRYWEPYA